MSVKLCEDWTTAVLQRAQIADFNFCVQHGCLCHSRPVRAPGEFAPPRSKRWTSHLARNVGPMSSARQCFLHGQPLKPADLSASSTWNDRRREGPRSAGKRRGCCSQQCALLHERVQGKRDVWTCGCHFPKVTRSGEAGRCSRVPCQPNAGMASPRCNSKVIRQFRSG